MVHMGVVVDQYIMVHLLLVFVFVPWLQPTNQPATQLSINVNFLHSLCWHYGFCFPFRSRFLFVYFVISTSSQRRNLSVISTHRSTTSIALSHHHTKYEKTFTQVKDTCGNKIHKRERRVVAMYVCMYVCRTHNKGYVLEPFLWKVTFKHLLFSCIIVYVRTCLLLCFFYACIVRSVSVVCSFILFIHNTNFGRRAPGGMGDSRYYYAVIVITQLKEYW